MSDLLLENSREGRADIDVIQLDFGLFDHGSRTVQCGEGGGGLSFGAISFFDQSARGFIFELTRCQRRAGLIQIGLAGVDILTANQLAFRHALAFFQR